MRESATAILAYHRIADARADPLRMCVSPPNFRSQMQRLRDIAEVIPIHEVSERARGPRVVLTFDDGYQDFFSEAVPVLVSERLAATAFVVTGQIGSECPFWWESTATLVDRSPAAAVGLHRAVGTKNPLVLAGSALSRRIAMRTLLQRLRKLPSDRIEEALSGLSVRVGQEKNHCRAMTADELQEASDAPGMSIGAHGDTHSYLSSLSPEDQRREVFASKSSLEGITGRTVDTFAYPFGNRGSFSRMTEQIVQQAGFQLACTNEAGRVQDADSGMLRLPRYVVGDWDAGTFEAWLCRILRTKGTQ